MLNRRLIRIRAMQTLYALEKAKGANYLLAQDLISELFAPDLNSMEKQDKPKLIGYQKLAQSLFYDEVFKNNLNPDEIPNREIKHALTKAREFLKNKNKEDTETFGIQCLIDAEKVYELYLYILLLLIEIGKKFEGVNNLSKNRLIKTLADSEVLEVQTLKRGISFKEDQAFIQSLFNDALKNNVFILEYAEKVNHTSEDEQAILKYIIKNIILKHQISCDFFEQKSIFWVEDREILRTMTFATFKNYVENGSVEIEKLDDIWDESKDFLRILYYKTASEDAQLMEYLLPLLRNWEYERIIETDKILLKLAATELMNFPSIPIKVTINEIIEISKNYSSAKSGQFINGVLDTLVQKLTKSGIIKKSGRGMMDNK